MPFFLDYVNKKYFFLSEKSQERKKKSDKVIINWAAEIPYNACWTVNNIKIHCVESTNFKHFSRAMKEFKFF